MNKHFSSEELAERSEDIQIFLVTLCQLDHDIDDEIRRCDALGAMLCMREQDNILRYGAGAKKWGNNDR